MTADEGQAPPPTPPTSVQALNTGTVTRHVQALAVWKQGDVIKTPDGTHLPLTWVRPLGVDPITGMENTQGVFAPFFHRDAHCLFVVASQTCDVSGADTGKAHPLVMAAPLVPETTFAKSVVGDAQRNRVPYVIPSSYTDLAMPDTAWFADLRLLVPLSKGVLLTCTRHGTGFDGDRLNRFAVGLGHKFSRAAVDDALIEELPKAINAHIAAVGPADPAFVGTEEVRLHLETGSPIGATAVRVIVIVEASAINQARKKWKGDWEKSARAKLAKRGFVLGKTTVVTAKMLKADIYRNTTALRIDALGPLRWF